MKVLPFKVPSSGEVSFRVQVDDDKYFYDTFHRHPEIQIMSIEKGEGTFICGEHVQEFKPGMIIVAGANQPHVFRSYDNYYQPDSDLRCRAVSLYFGEESFGTGFFDIPEMRDVKTFIDRSARGMVFGESMSLLVQRKVAEMVEMKPFDRFFQLMNILKILSASKEFDYLSDEVSNRHFDEKEGRRMNAIFEFTLKEFDRTITLEEVANVANMTPNAFCRFFKERTRKTYVNFLNEIRISNACKLLRDKDLTVAQVCYQSGFNNLSHFNRNFKRFKGMSPTQFQKAIFEPGVVVA